MRSLTLTCLVFALCIAQYTVAQTSGTTVTNSTGHPVDRFVVLNDVAYMMRSDKPKTDGVVTVDLKTGATGTIPVDDVAPKGGIAINAVGSDAGLFIADTYGWIRKLDQSKKWAPTNFYRFTDQVIDALAAPPAGASNTDYAVFALTQGKVYGIKSNGEPYQLNSTSLAQVSDISVSPDGTKLYVLDQLQISVIDVATNVLSFFAANNDAIHTATRLAAGATGIYVMGSVDPAVFLLPYTSPSAPTQVTATLSSPVEIALFAQSSTSHTEAGDTMVAVSSGTGNSDVLAVYNAVGGSPLPAPSPGTSPTPVPKVSPGVSPVPPSNHSASPSPNITVSPSASPSNTSPTPKPGFNNNPVLNFFDHHAWAIYALMALTVILLCTTLGCWICRCRDNAHHDEAESRLINHQYA